MKTKEWSALILALVSSVNIAHACINDSKTSKMLWQEKFTNPSLAQAILSPKIEKADIPSLVVDLELLKSNPKTNDPAWWNDLAGAYLRLGQPSEAVKILEPITNRFADNYGVHANLGTAYHLLGRYADAEKEIRRDLEINPEAHFGVEKYHLALLQYLSRDRKYQARHVFVNEFTRTFFSEGKWKYDLLLNTSRADADSSKEAETKDLEKQADAALRNSSALNFHGLSVLYTLSVSDPGPGYVEKWDLGRDPKLEDGVLYMAALNPKEPACKVMLGVLAIRHKDMHLAKAAFEQAIQLGSPQAPLLRHQIARLDQYWTWPFPDVPIPLLGAGIVIFLLIAYYIFGKRREFKAWRARRKVAI